MEKLLWLKSGKNVGKHYGKNKSFFFDFYGVIYIVRKVILCRIWKCNLFLKLVKYMFLFFLFTKKD